MGQPGLHEADWARAVARPQGQRESARARSGMRLALRRTDSCGESAGVHVGGSRGAAPRSGRPCTCWKIGARRSEASSSFLYYPSQQQPPAALSALIDTLRSYHNCPRHFRAHTPTNIKASLVHVRQDPLCTLRFGSISSRRGRRSDLTTKEFLAFMGLNLSPRLMVIVDALPLRHGIRVLEIGCGPGAAAREIARRIGRGHVLGIDRSAKAITLAKAASPTEIASGILS